MARILDGRLATNDQMVAAVKFLKAAPAGAAVDEAALDTAAGVGVVVTAADIAAAVAEAFEANRAAICEERYQFNFMKLMQPIKQIGDMAWADIAAVKGAIEAQKLKTLGPKTAEDEQPKAKAKKVKAPKVRGCPLLCE